MGYDYQPLVSSVQLMVIAFKLLDRAEVNAFKQELQIGPAQ